MTTARSRRPKGTGTLYRRKGSAYWWMRITVDGREERSSTHQTNWNGAMKVLNARATAIRKGDSPRPATAVRVNDLLEMLAADYEAKNRKSLKTVQGHIEVLKAALGSRRAADIRYDELLEFGRSWQRDDLSPATINRRFAALRRAYNLGCRAGRLSSPPAFPSFKEDNVRQGFVDPEDFGRLLQQLPDDGLRDFVEWLGITGQRRGEAMKLQWSYLHKTPKGEELRIPASDTKTGRPRIIPIAGRLVDILRRRRKRRRPPCPLIFHRNGQRIWEFRKSWRTAAKAASLDVLPHDLRRSAIRNLMTTGVDQATAMKVSGHRTADVFRRYQIVTTDDQARALERVSALHRHASAPARGGADRSGRR